MSGALPHDRSSVAYAAFAAAVTVSLVAASCALRFQRGLGLVLAPLAILLTLGTVYGQFHYALDALAGALVAAAVLALVGALPRGNMAGPSAGA